MNVSSRADVTVLFESPSYGNQTLFMLTSGNLKETLRRMERQNWGVVGLKVTFATSDVPTEKQTFFLLEWFLGENLTLPKVVVLDVDVLSGTVQDLAVLHKTYGNWIEFVPGFSGTSLSVVVADLAPSGESSPRSREHAERILNEVGQLVAKHGAYLDLDMVNPSVNGSCRNKNLGIWRDGRYLVTDQYVIADVDVRVPFGLMVHEELHKRSNNHVGIIVTVPSAGYAIARSCSRRPTRVNRHARRQRRHSVITYTREELSDIVHDIAKWGVVGYSLGHVDYTVGKQTGPPTLIEIANIVKTATDQVRTLRYRYIRNVTFEQDGYSQALVNGIYKLEAGMFFQRATYVTLRVKSFATIPGLENVRVGLASAINVGAPLKTEREENIDAVAIVDSIPPDTHLGERWRETLCEQNIGADMCVTLGDEQRGGTGEATGVSFTRFSAGIE